MAASVTVNVTARARGLWTSRLTRYATYLPIPLRWKTKLVHWAASRLRIETRVGDGPWRPTSHRFGITARQEA